MHDDDDDDAADNKMSVSAVEETGLPGEKHRPTAINWRDLYTYRS